MMGSYREYWSPASRLKPTKSIYVLRIRKKLYRFDDQHTSSYLLGLIITGLYQDTKVGFEKKDFTSFLAFMSNDLNYIDADQYTLNIHW